MDAVAAAAHPRMSNNTMAYRLATILLACTIVGWSSMARSQDASNPRPGDEAATDQEPDPRQFPPPLERVSGNITDVEAEGYFALRGVRFGISPAGREERVTWTVRVQRPLTARHAMMRLRRLHDVRFYDTRLRLARAIESSRLYHSSSIELRAINGDVLAEGEEFEVWVPLTAKAIRRLNSQSADKVVFGKVRR
jgi:hypothetical protein